jgi:Family of unknown function (DUF6615)
MTWVSSEKAGHDMMRGALADVLINRAAWTHARLQAGRNYGVELHEETITQDLLLDISAALPAMSVRTFTKRKEARNGADWQWEWWFEGQRWFGLRVQAKRLKMLRSQRLVYDLGYRVGSKRQRQVDLLLEDACADGLQAAYVLYNGPDLDISKFTWGCRRLPPSPAFFGVSLLPAAIARELVDARTVELATVGARSRPWWCLVSCNSSAGCDRSWWSETSSPAHPGNDSEDLAWWVALSFSRIEMQARRTEEPDADLGLRFIPRLLPGLREGPPSYVADLLAQNLLADDVLPPRVGALTVFLSSAAGSLGQP